MRSIGVNLFSLRSLIATEDGLGETLTALKAMGYNCAQFSGAPFNAEVIKRASEAAGVPIVITHVPLADILNRTDALMEEHASFGCKYIGLGTLPRESITDERMTKDTIERLERAAERMSAQGFRFFYHNHHTDCYKHGGETVLDYMIRTCPHFNFLLDTYWLQFGGLSVADYIKKLSGRIACVHLKDYRIKAEQKDDGSFAFSPIYAPVGEGNLDFASYYPLFRAAGVEHYLVEQDNAVSFPDPLDELRRSALYIKENFANG